MSGLDPLDEPRAALERGDWQLALELLAAGGSEASSAEGLELRARAAYGNGDFEASVSAWEDLHALLVAEGDDIEAARAAAMTAMYLMMDTGLMAPVRGWLRRAERLLDGAWRGPRPRGDRDGSHLRALHVWRHGCSAHAVGVGDRARRPARRRPGCRDRAGRRRPAEDLRRSRR